MTHKIIIFGLTGLTAILGIVMVLFYSEYHTKSEFSGLEIMFWAIGWGLYFGLFLSIALIVNVFNGNSAGMTAFLFSLVVFMLSLVFSIIASKITTKNHKKHQKIEMFERAERRKKIIEAFKTDSLNPVLLYEMAKMEGCYPNDCDKAITYLQKAIEIDTNYLSAYKELCYFLRVDNRINEEEELKKYLSNRKETIFHFCK